MAPELELVARILNMLASVMPLTDEAEGMLVSLLFYIASLSFV